MLKSLGLDMPAKAKEQNGQDAVGKFNLPKNLLWHLHKKDLAIELFQARLVDWGNQT